MVFINPLAFYHSDDIPDLNPQDDDEARGCICGVCGYIIASAIFVWLMHFILNFRLNGIISTDVHFILILISCIIIYPTLTIILMKLSFKIADKFITKKKKYIKGKITFSGKICDFELITRNDLIERGYKYMEKVSGILYKDYDVDFDVPKVENFTEVKLTFNDGKEIKLDGAEIDSIIPTVRGTFTVFLPANLTPAFYEDVKKIEIK